MIGLNTVGRFRQSAEHRHVARGFLAEHADQGERRSECWIDLIANDAYEWSHSRTETRSIVELSNPVDYQPVLVGERDANVYGNMARQIFRPYLSVFQKSVSGENRFVPFWRAHVQIYARTRLCRKGHEPIA